MNQKCTGSQEFLTLTTLKKEYRLSPKWIERLGHPDKEVRNPHYRCAAPVKLWNKDRVEIFLKEHAEEYQQQLSASQKRGERGKATAEKKRTETLEWARTVELSLRPFPKNLEKACENHLEVLAWGRSLKPGDYCDAPEVNERRIVNMLRHEYTNYHSLLDLLFRRVGRWEAYPIIKNRVNSIVCERLKISLTAEISSDSDRDFVRGRWGEASEGTQPNDKQQKQDVAT
jgi:hypothetical protein